ncbi:hypothetical protein BHE18_08980 [Rossellomorea aquimaris]|uniref:Uncharacterized protein n=1 Tax=Rossellomorea aquimaris TaxID=189382 RepID=A0A1J6VZA6_9BACI|nr:hypothetical protein BHE18_08980 [Rossellomorea aquimaris]
MDWRNLSIWQGNLRSQAVNLLILTINLLILQIILSLVKIRKYPELNLSLARHHSNSPEQPKKASAKGMIPSQRLTIFMINL